jgi:antibiotic biosynthesis monooxygenase (ABM) superfamily enzyme
MATGMVSKYIKSILIIVSYYSNEMIELTYLYFYSNLLNIYITFNFCNSSSNSTMLLNTLCSCSLI